MFGTIIFYGLFVLWGYLAMATLRLVISDGFTDEKDVKKWQTKHPYHVIAGWLEEVDNDEIEGRFLGFVVFGFILPTIIFVIFFSFGLIPSHFCLSFGFGMGAYWSVATIYFIYRKLLKTNRLFTKSWWQNLGQRLKNYRNVLAPKEIFEAKYYQKSLMSLINGYKNEPQLQPILIKVDKLVKKELPKLLKRRIQLNKAVTNSKQTIARQKKNGICQGEETLMSDSEASLQYFQQKQQEVEAKIALILAFLDHSTPKVSRIIDAISAQSDNEAESLIQQVNSDLALLLQSQEEVAEMQAKYLQADMAARKVAFAEVQDPQKKVSGC
jgi:hypothetical protein